jgi:hypothetical protein
MCVVQKVTWGLSRVLGGFCPSKLLWSRDRNPLGGISWQKAHKPVPTSEIEASIGSWFVSSISFTISARVVYSAFQH